MHIAAEMILMIAVFLFTLYNRVKCYNKCFLMAAILYSHRNFICSCKNIKNNSNSQNWISCDTAEVSQQKKKAYVVYMTLIDTIHS